MGVTKEDRACLNKHRYFTEDEAKRAVERRKKTCVFPLFYYECSYGGTKGRERHWHLTKVEQRTREKDAI